MEGVAAGVGGMKGVSVYQRKGRGVWYISFPDPESYLRRSLATPFRLDDPEGEKKAYDLARERAAVARVHGPQDAELWEAWVLPFLQERYRKQPLTLRRYSTSWRYVRLYLEELNLRGPRAVNFQHVRGYIAWRTGRVKRTGKSASHNTAITDLKAFQVVLAEAVRREWIKGNPCRDLGICREPAREKPEISDEDMARIVAELDRLVAERPHKSWMRISWEIARWQGCRLSATQFDIRRQVNFRDGTIWFQEKGRNGRPAVHTAPLHPELRVFLQGLLDKGQTFTCKFPRMGIQSAGAASKFFREFFDGLGLPEVSFHCTRVTVITKLLRAQVPLATVMEYVGHADEEVNRIYRRLKPRDIAPAALALSYRPSG